MTGFTGCATAVTGMFGAVADDAADTGTFGAVADAAAVTGTFGAVADTAAVSRVFDVPADAAAVVMGNAAVAAVTTDVTADWVVMPATDDADVVISFTSVSVAGPEHTPSRS